MSTHLEHGFRLHPPKPGTAPDPFSFIAAARAALDPIRQSAYIVALARRAVEYLDTAEHTDQPVAAARAYLQKKHKRVLDDGIRQPGYDFTCTLTVGPDPNDSAGPLYVLVFAEMPEYLAAVEQLPGVEHWPYWNSTDGPADVSAEDWDARGQTWDRVLTDQANPSQLRPRLSWDLHTRWSDYAVGATREKILAAIPSRAERARMLARSKVVAFDSDGDLRPAEDIRADVDAAASEIEPTLPEVTESLLWPGR